MNLKYFSKSDLTYAQENDCEEVPYIMYNRNIIIELQDTRRCDIPFSDYIVKQAWTRSGGRCECVKTIHGHPKRCNKKLLELYRGDHESDYGWEVYSKSGSYLNDPLDCEIICWDCLEEIRYL